MQEGPEPNPTQKKGVSDPPSQNAVQYIIFIPSISRSKSFSHEHFSGPPTASESTADLWQLKNSVHGLFFSFKSPLNEVLPTMCLYTKMEISKGMSWSQC